MSEHIDQLFKRSNFEKRISIRSSAWQKVEQKLTYRKQRQRRRNFLFVAASFAFLMLTISGLSLFSTSYELDSEPIALINDLNEYSSLYSAKDIAQINTIYLALENRQG